jgi:glycosyltransferase involved in cell wall biosynthesis
LRRQLMNEDLLLLLVIFCVAFPAIQSIYLSIFLLAFNGAKVLRLSADKAGVENNHVPASVIVCAHDEEENLKVLVPLLLEQDHPDFEIIVVNDRSNDGSHDYLFEAVKKHPRLRMVQVAHTPGHITGKKYALTLGIKAARHEWVVLTDADCRPDSRSWLRAMSQLFTGQKQIVIGCSPYYKEPGLLNSFVRFETMLTMIQYVGLALVGRPYMGVGRNLAYRKSLFLDNKGFNDHLGVTGGDDDLFVNQHASRKNVAVALGAETLVHSIPKKTFKAWFRQKIRHLSVGKHYRGFDKLLLGTFSLSWIASWFILLAIPFAGQYTNIIIGAFLLRLILLVSLFALAGRKVGEPVALWSVPFLDFNYMFYYLVAGPVASLSKKVRWKS